MRRFCPLLVLVAGCTLPAETKTGCRSSADCIDDRICVELECQPGGCDPVCELACEQAGECGLDIASCEAECTQAGGLLDSLSPTDCKGAWDVLFEDDDCSGLECLGYCNDLCVRAAECLLIDDAGACTLGCERQRPGCSGVAPQSCANVPGDVQCWERGGC